jgi:hypothetical protein
MRKSMQFGRLAALAGLLAAALTLTAQTAAASTIHACVNKHSGNARIVGAKAKCKHSERRVSWNTSGPAGAPGAPGTAGTVGTDGSNGVGVDYASASFDPVMLTPGEKGDVVLTKAIPAGSYLVSGKTVVGGTAEKAVFLGIICELVDTTGAPALVAPPLALDLGEWAQQLSSTGSGFTAAGTIVMQGQLTTTQPSTIAMLCDPAEDEEGTASAVASQLSALQTTANK